MNRLLSHHLQMCHLLMMSSRRNKNQDESLGFFLLQPTHAIARHHTKDAPFSRDLTTRDLCVTLQCPNALATQVGLVTIISSSPRLTDSLLITNIVINYTPIAHTMCMSEILFGWVSSGNKAIVRNVQSLPNLILFRLPNPLLQEMNV